MLHSTTNFVSFLVIIDRTGIWFLQAICVPLVFVIHANNLIHRYTGDFHACLSSLAATAWGRTGLNTGEDGCRWSLSFVFASTLSPLGLHDVAIVSSSRAYLVFDRRQRHDEKRMSFVARYEFGRCCHDETRRCCLLCLACVLTETKTTETQ